MDSKRREELERRIEISKGISDSNCIGTALYLAGLRDADELDDRLELPELEHHKKVTSPGNNQILLIEEVATCKGQTRIGVAHAAYLFERDGQITVAERLGIGGEFKVSLYPSESIPYWSRILDSEVLKPVITKPRISFYQISQ